MKDTTVATTDRTIQCCRSPLTSNYSPGIRASKREPLPDFVFTRKCPNLSSSFPFSFDFRRPKATCLTQKQGSTDILNADVSELDLRPSRPGSDGSTDVSHPHLNGLSHSPPSGIPDLGIPDLGSPPGTGNVILANGELSLLHLTQQHHSTNPPNSATSAHNSNGSAFTYHFDPSMTSSATSNTNSVGSNFDPFETGHSRSNSSQTSSSRISTGFNSLPSHSRQGSADSENTGNAR